MQINNTSSGNLRLLPRTKNLPKVFVCAVVIVASFCTLGIARGEGYGFTKDMTPVDIGLENSTPEFWAEHNPGRPYPIPVKLRIPKAYMYFTNNWKGGNQEFIVMEVQPNMTPTAFGEDPYKNFNDSFQVKLEALGEKRFYYDTYIVNFRKKYIPVKSENALYDQYLSGPSKPDASGYDMRQNTVFIPKDVSPENAVYIECKTVDVMCTIHDEVDSKLRTTIVVPKNEPEEWMNIRANVRKLVSQFYVNP